MIEIQNLSKRFPTPEGFFTALEGINLTIDDGDIFGIVGMSGAGKSTLVRCINLLERPTEGRVLAGGLLDAGNETPVDLCTLPPAQLRQARRAISMIFQQFNLLMQRTCLKNICFPLEIAGVPAAKAKKRAIELLEIVGLPDKADAYPSQLSGGQKQRIAIARALASDPKVLLCDEATSALDPNTTRSILRLIQDINKRLGITVIVITHEMAVVEEICTKVAILDHGRVAEAGTVKEVFSNPKTEAGRRLVYPDGVQITHQLPGSHIVRLVFDGGTAYQPLIACLAIDCGVKANILGAETKNVDGRAYGYILLGLPDSEAEAAKAISYLKNQPDLTIEEVENYHV